MSVAAREPKYLTPDEYLTLERRAEFKSEYANGEMYAMSGGSLPHSIIAGNLGRLIGNQLVDRPCIVLNSDMKVWIEEVDKFTYPDLSALCGEPRFYGESQDVITNPSFIAEVLSPSTELYDRGDKFRKCQRLLSLKEYLLVSQSEMLVELYKRQDDGTWNLRGIDLPDELIQLPSIECKVRLGDLYQKVEFESAGEAE